ncbi:MAG: hypothetical protein HW394_63, partial [Acidobacteria bacterium]|nr:hypothetical protein [Acidobacteriota bacterium]
MRSYYDILDVAPTASADEIKRAFRREIAKYHPDKVEHLGREFHDIAAVKTGELTQAYKTLTEASLRADYDAQLKSGAAAPPDRPGPASSPQAQDVPSGRGTTARTASEGTSPPEPDPAPGRRSAFSQDRAGASDLVRKAAVMRFRQATN